MKIFSTESFDVHHFQERSFSLNRNSSKKKRSNDFKKILEETMEAPCEDLDGFRVLLPRNGRFWDNGYEDKE